MDLRRNCWLSKNCAQRSWLFLNDYQLLEEGSVGRNWVINQFYIESVKVEHVKSWEFLTFQFIDIIVKVIKAGKLLKM
jgi:hypothetical protein